MQSGFSFLAVSGVALLSVVTVRAVEMHLLTDYATRTVPSVSGSAPGAPVYSDVSNVWSVAFDPYRGEVYCSDLTTGRILRRALDGSTDEIVLEDPGAVLRGLVVDSRSDRLYYLDSDSDTLNVCRLDGEEKEVLFSELRRPNDMAMDSVNRCLYLTDSGVDGVLRYDLDSGAAEWAVSGSVVDGVWGIALVPEENVMYLSDHVHNSIMRCGLDGQGLTTLVTDMETPRGLTVDRHHNRLYWLEAESGRLLSSGLDGTAPAQVTVATFLGLRDLWSYESTDTDGDFLNDSWEKAYLGGLEGDPGDDSDEDGQTDGGEFRFGSSPINPDDMARVLFEFDHSAPGGVLRFSYRERDESWIGYDLVHSKNWASWGAAPGVLGSSVEYPGGVRTRVVSLDASLYDPATAHFFRVNASQ